MAQRFRDQKRSWNRSRCRRFQPPQLSVLGASWCRCGAASCFIPNIFCNSGMSAGKVASLYLPVRSNWWSRAALDRTLAAKSKAATSGSWFCNLADLANYCSLQPDALRCLTRRQISLIPEGSDVAKSWTLLSRKTCTDGADVCT